MHATGLGPEALNLAQYRSSMQTQMQVFPTSRIVDINSSALSKKKTRRKNVVDEAMGAANSSSLSIGTTVVTRGSNAKKNHELQQLMMRTQALDGKKGRNVSQMHR